MVENMDTKILVRKAMYEDKDAIIEISKHVWLGFDYVPSMFYEILNDPLCHPYILEYNGNVAAFKYFVELDDGETAASLGTRVDEKYRGLHLLNVIHEESVRQFRIERPAIKRITWSAVKQPIYKSLINGERKDKNWQITQTWNLSLHLVTAEELNKNPILQLQHTSECPVDDVIVPNLDLGVKMISNPKNIQEVFNNEQLGIGINWIPFTPSSDNPKPFLQSHRVTATTCSSGDAHIKYFSHLYVHEVTKGVQFQMVFYGKDSSLFKAHFVDNVKHIASLGHSESIPLWLAVSFPLGNEDDIRSFLELYFGTRVADSEAGLSPDQAVMVIKELD